MHIVSQWVISNKGLRENTNIFLNNIEYELSFEMYKLFDYICNTSIYRYGYIYHFIKLKNLYAQNVIRVYISFFIHNSVFYMTQMPTALSKIMERIWIRQCRKRKRIQWLTLQNGMNNVPWSFVVHVTLNHNNHQR